TDEQHRVCERNRQRWAEERRPNVARAIVVAPAEVMAVLPVTRCDFLDKPIEIGDRARLELDRRHGGGRADDEDRGKPGSDLGLGDSRRHEVGNVVRVALPPRRDVAPRRDDHAAILLGAYRGDLNELCVNRSCGALSSHLSRIGRSTSSAVMATSWPPRIARLTSIAGRQLTSPLRT